MKRIKKAKLNDRPAYVLVGEGCGDLTLVTIGGEKKQAAPPIIETLMRAMIVTDDCFSYHPVNPLLPSFEVMAPDIQSGEACGPLIAEVSRICNAMKHDFMQLESKEHGNQISCLAVDQGSHIIVVDHFNSQATFFSWDRRLSNMEVILEQVAKFAGVSMSDLMLTKASLSFMWG